MDDEAALRLLDAEFGGATRPATFVDASHCDECAEHEALLQRTSPLAMSFADFGMPGWDPVGSLKCEGLAYFLPGLARLALYRGSHRDYTSQFCRHLDASRMACFTTSQRQAVRSFVEYFRESRVPDIRSNPGGLDDLARLDELVSALGG